MEQNLTLEIIYMNSSEFREKPLKTKTKFSPKYLATCPRLVL